MSDLLKFYKIIVNGYSTGGVLYAPPSWPCPIAQDGIEVQNWESLVLELRDGYYRHFNMCVGQANIVSKQFMDTLLYNGNENLFLEFLPVRTHSEEYGDKTFYIMHFKKVFDVIDKEHTHYVPGTDSIIKLWVDYQKTKDLDVYNYHPFTNSVIVSEKIKKALCRNKLNEGILFQPVFCFSN